MTIEVKRSARALGGGVIFLAAVVLLLSWALPGPRRPFDYMVVGCFATTLVLATLFVLLVMRRP